MDAENVSKFLVDFVGAGAKQETFEKVENQKRAVVENLFKEELTPEKKDQIREGMTFRLVDAKNKKQEKSFAKYNQQENAIDTFGSVKRGHGISSKDQPKVQKAMDMIVELTRKAIDKVKDLTTPDGVRVYDFGNKDEKIAAEARRQFTTFIELEVFTPLVREGLLPETFVLDDFSEVQKLLNNTFSSYKKSTEEDRKAKELKVGKMETDFHGGGSGLDQLKALGGKAGQLKQHLIGKVMSENTQETLGNVYKYTKQGTKTVIAGAKIYSQAKAWSIKDDDGVSKAEKTQMRFLKPKENLRDDDGNSLITEDRKTIKVKDEGGKEFDKVLSDQELKDTWSEDKLRVAMEQSKREALYADYIHTIGGFIPGLNLSKEDAADLSDKICYVIDNFFESDPYFYTDAGIDLLKTSIEDAIEIATKSYGIHVSRGKLEEIGREFHVRKAAIAAIDDMQKAIKDTVTKRAGAPAAEAFDGLFEDKVDVDEFLANAVPKPDGVAMASTAAAGLQAVFVAAAPPLDPLFSMFISAGEKAASVLRGKTPGKDIEKGLKNAPDKAFAPFIDAVRTAVEAALDKDLVQALNDPETVKAIAAKAALPDEEEALAEIEQSEAEIREYERTLVLIDEGGVSQAEQHSLEKMIEQLQKDRQVLELVAQLGGTIDSLGGTSVGVANWAREDFTDVVAGEVCGALKAAKLIMQLAVNVKKAADRWALWYAFRKDLERSEKAVSSLSSTIQGFFNNKREQITFRTIEDALLAVQAAAAILGTIPEPYTMAIGKTMGVVASAGQEALKLSEMIYTDVKLKEAWAVTKEALDNPRDRACGLKALRLNPTLGMHAIAWAAMEKTPPDPIARMFLGSVGVTEQTLAVSGSEDKVRAYLEELLNEDRTMLDSSKIKTDWAPDPITLTVKDWFVCINRGETVAVPKLRAGGGKGVLEALKKVNKHDVNKLETDAAKGAIKEDQMKVYQDEAKALCEVLNAYSATATDGSHHGDMQSLADQFLKLASLHRDKIMALSAVNKKERDPTFVNNLLDGDIDLFEVWFAEDEGPPLGIDVDAFEESTMTIRLHMDQTKLKPAFSDNKEVQDRLIKLETFFDKWIDWKNKHKLAPVINRRRSNVTVSRKPPKPELAKTGG
jgi:hypothetical protein